MAPESAIRKFAPLTPMPASQKFLAQNAAGDFGLFLDDHFVLDAQLLGENVGDVVAGQMQRGRDDVIRALVGQLKDVFAEIGFHGFQLMLFQALVEMDLLAGHGFRFHQHMHAALLREIENEVGGFLAGAAVDDVAAVRDHVRFQLLEIVIEILDGVLLDGVGFVAEILVIGQSLGADDVGAMIDQAAGSGVDGKLQTGIVEGLLDVSFRSFHFRRRQHLGKMQRSDRQARAIDDALELHQATGIDGNDGGSAGLLNGIDFGARHGARNLGEFDGERAAEAAAFFGRVHFREREALNFCQQFSRAALMCSSRKAWQLS